MPSSKAGQSLLEKLPSELMIEILGSTTDIRSLITIKCSCTKIYKTSAEAQSEILPRVLSRELGNAILPEAIAVLQSSKSTWTKPTAHKFLSETFNERKIPKHNWSFADGVAVLNYITKSQNLQPTFLRKPLQLPVERFRNLSSIDFNVHSIDLKYFNDLVEHDVEWGKFMVDYAVPSEPNYYIMPILSHGINRVFSIMNANGYEEKHPCFWEEYRPDSGSLIFLPTALDGSNTDNDGRDLMQYTDDEIANLPRPYFQDPDTGPFEAWYTEHELSSEAYFVNDERQLTKRKWGYVMWDKARFDNMGRLRDDWESVDDGFSIADDLRFSARKRASCDRREEIYNQGGRGWWSFEDESKINWEIRDRVIAERAEKEDKPFKPKKFETFESIEAVREYFLPRRPKPDE